MATCFLAALDQACVGGNRVDACPAVELVHFIEQHAAENRANPGHRLPQGEGMGIVVFGGFEDRAFQVCA